MSKLEKLKAENQSLKETCEILSDSKAMKDIKKSLGDICLLDLNNSFIAINKPPMKSVINIVLKNLDIFIINSQVKG